MLGAVSWTVPAPVLVRAPLLVTEMGALIRSVFPLLAVRTPSFQLPSPRVRPLKPPPMTTLLATAATAPLFTVSVPEPLRVWLAVLKRRELTVGLAAVIVPLKALTFSRFAGAV